MRPVITAIRFALAAAIFVMGLEVCARLGDLAVYGAPFSGSYSSENLFLRDALGKRGRPGGSYRQWQMNSLGFRGPEIDWSRTRIVCFGASEMFGMFEDPGDELPRMIERDLNSRPPARYQVVNAALPGESTATAIRRVPEIAATVRPAFAVIYPSLAPYITLSAIGHEGAQGAPDAPRFEWRLPEWISDVVKARLPMRAMIWYRQYQIRKGSAGHRLMDRLPEKNVQRFEADSLALIESLQSRRIEPVLVTHATVFGDKVPVDDRYLMLTWRAFYPDLKEAGFLDMERRMNDVLRRLAARHGIPLIDLAAVMPPSRRYFADAVHFTDAGAELAAAAIAAGLRPALAGENAPDRPDSSDAAGNGTSTAPKLRSAALSRHVSP